MGDMKHRQDVCDINEMNGKRDFKEASCFKEKPPKDMAGLVNSQYGILPPLPAKTVPAMAYVPYQQQGAMYGAEQGIVSGTLFPVLNKPFYGAKCTGRHGGDGVVRKFSPDDIYGCEED